MKFFAIVDLENIDSLNEGLNRLPNKEGNFTPTTILNYVYALIGLVAVFYIVLAAVNFAMAQGDVGKVTKAKNTIVFAVIGLIIVVLAAAVTNFALTALN